MYLQGKGKTKKHKQKNLKNSKKCLTNSQTYDTISLQGKERESVKAQSKTSFVGKTLWGRL